MGFIAKVLWTVGGWQWTWRHRFALQHGGDEVHRLDLPFEADVHPAHPRAAREGRCGRALARAARLRTPNHD